MRGAEQGSALNDTAGPKSGHKGEELTYVEAHSLIETARSRTDGKPLENNTRLHERIGRNGKTEYAVRLHATDVVRLTSRGTFVLDSGGWRTNTTSNRINHYIPEGYRLRSVRGNWTVERYTPNDPEKRIVRQRAYRDGQPVTQRYPRYRYDDATGHTVPDGEQTYTHTPQIPDGWTKATIEEPWRKIADFADGIEVRIKDGKVTMPPKKPKPWPGTRKVRGPVLAWHIVDAEGKTGHGDLTVRAGETYSVEGDPALCVHGLHASRRLLDALTYNHGPMVCRVELSGKIIEQTDKLCATRRKVLWMVNAEKELTEARGTLDAVKLERRVMELHKEQEREADV